MSPVASEFPTTFGAEWMCDDEGQASASALGVGRGPWAGCGRLPSHATGAAAAKKVTVYLSGGNEPGEKAVRDAGPL